MDDPAVRGELPFEWLFGNPQPGTEPTDQEDVAEFLETFKNSTAQDPRDRTNTGCNARRRTATRWSTQPHRFCTMDWNRHPLKVTISVNGSTLVTGTATSTGKKRGESDLPAQTPGGGRSTMAVVNTSAGSNHRHGYRTEHCRAQRTDTNTLTTYLSHMNSRQV
jgi:hypothetical protein